MKIEQLQIEYGIDRKASTSIQYPDPALCNAVTTVGKGLGGPGPQNNFRYILSIYKRMVEYLDNS